MRYKILFIFILIAALLLNSSPASPTYGHDLYQANNQMRFPQFSLVHKYDLLFPDPSNSSHPFVGYAPKLGEFKVLILYLEFSNYNHSTTIASIKTKVTKSNQYFIEVSYGKLWFNISSLDQWLRLNNTLEYYGQDSNTQIDVNWRQFLDDSLSMADPYVDYRNYDFVMLVHAGNDQASSNNPDDIWSKASFGKWYFSYDGGVYLGFVVVAETDPYGVFTHELAHNLEIDDLYDSTGQEEFVGVWSLMGYGAWLSPPTSLLAVEKIWMGWIPVSNYTTVSLDEVKTLYLYPLENTGANLAVKIPVGTIYYTVEYRRRINTDSALPSEGIIICRVDESLPSGSGVVKVVDKNPSTPSKNDAAFVSGDTYINLNDDFYVKIVSLSTGYAVVRVQNGIPNLYITGISLASAGGGTYNISVNVMNNGGPTGGFQVSLYIDGGFYNTLSYNSTLSRNTGTNIIFSNVLLSAGNHTLQAIVDPNDVVIERNETDNSYTSSISIRSLYVLDKYVATDDRADVGSTQTLWLHFINSTTGLDHGNKQVIVNGTTYTTNSTGWITITVSSNEAKALKFIVTDLNATQEVVPQIIFDKIIVNISFKDNRIDIGSSAELMFNAYYAYDGSPFNGYIYLNDTLSKDVVGIYWYTVARITDNNYNLTVFESNTAYVIFDRVIINITVLDDRVGVGTKTSPINITAVYDYDDTQFEGEVLFNNSIPMNTVGKYWYKVVGINDTLYSLTKFICNDTFYIIYDQVNVNLTVYDNRINVGETANISISAFYAYDGQVFNGEIILNESLTHNVVGKYFYTVQSIVDNLYGIESFSSNVVYVIYDRINITLTVDDNRINIGENASIKIIATYEYDGSPLAGYVVLNDTTVKEVVGLYWYGVSTVVDELYNLSIYRVESVYVVFDAVRVSLSVEDDRIDVGSEVNITFTAYYAYDGSPYLGTVELNDTLVKTVVGRYCYGVIVYGDDPYGISAALYDPVYVVFDRVRIEMAVDNRVNVGDNAIEGINAYYEYDGTRFEGEIYLNDTAVKYEVGKYVYSIMGINDTKYGITVYVSEPVEVIFDKVIINIYPLRERYDVGSEAVLGIEAYYAYDGSPYDGIIVLNDTLVKYEPGFYTYSVAYIGNDTYGITLFEPNPVTIAFDRVRIELDIEDNRINVGDAANISITAYYELDGKPFPGEVFLNDTLSKDHVGRYIYSVKSIIDPIYNLTSFYSNTVSVIFDMVNITLTVEDSRIDVGSTASISIAAVYAYDGSPYDGEIVLNNTLTQSEVGIYHYSVERVGNDTHGITVFKSNVVSIVFDKVIIELKPAATRVEAGKKATISINAYYAYDHTPLSGEVRLNGSLTQYSVGLYTYVARLVRDNGYGLTVYESNMVKIIFDKLDMQVTVDTAAPFYYKISIGIYSEFNESYIPANITINGEEVDLSKYPQYKYVGTIVSPMPFQSINVEATVASTDFKYSEDVYSIGTLATYIIIPLIILVLIVLWIRRPLGLMEKLGYASSSPGGIDTMSSQSLFGQR